MGGRGWEVGEEIRGWRDQAKRKRTHGHGQQCGDCREEGSLKRLNGNGKNTVKILKSKVKVKHSKKRKRKKSKSRPSYHQSK